MAKERDPDDLDDMTDTDETARGLDDDEFEEEESEDLDDDELVDDERATGEVGSEGGSSGERVTTKQQRGRLRGSEATETARKTR